MKVLLGIVAAANVIFFASMYGGFFNENLAEPALPALNDAKIRQLREPVLVTTSAVSSVVSAVIEAKPAAASCMEWSDFSGTDLKRANDALAGLNLGEKLAQRTIEYNIGYWVYIPPLKNKVAINQKIAQLKARGVEEYFVVAESGEFQRAISLGVFKSEEAAQKFLESLASKDIRSAKIGERASKLKATVFVLSGLDVQTIEQLNALQKDFPASELKKIDCSQPQH
jgi:hypothetical protein